MFEERQRGRERASSHHHKILIKIHYSPSGRRGSNEMLPLSPSSICTRICSHTRTHLSLSRPLLESSSFRLQSVSLLSAEGDIINTVTIILLHARKDSGTQMLVSL